MRVYNFQTTGGNYSNFKDKFEKGQSFQDGKAERSTATNPSGKYPVEIKSDNKTSGELKHQITKKIAKKVIAATAIGKKELLPEEEREVREMKRKDTEIRNHERAHLAAGGTHVRGGVIYEYRRGPDGKNYVVGGKVNMDSSEIVGNINATIEKLKQVQKAALAPTKPSTTDRVVAGRVARLIERLEMKEQLEEEKEERIESGLAPSIKLETTEKKSAHPSYNINSEEENTPYSGRNINIVV